KAAPVPTHASYALSSQGGETSNDMAVVLATAVAGRAHVDVPAASKARADAAAARLQSSDAPFVRALLMASQRASTVSAPVLVGQASAMSPTIDRSQTLVWL